MTIEIQHISSGKRGITLTNGRPFLIESQYVKMVASWRVGDTVEVKKLDIQSLFPYEITNQHTGETILAAYNPV